MIDTISSYGAYELNGLFIKENILFMIIVFLCLIIMYLYTKIEKMKRELRLKEDCDSLKNKYK